MFARIRAGRPLRKAGFILLVVVSIPITLCLLLSAYTLVDRYLCVSRAAQNVGVPRSYDGLYQYINASLTPGLTREAALARLNRLGTSVVRSSEVMSDNTVRDTIQIDICAYPLNDILLYIRYSNGGELLSHYIDVD